jgi:hypothetical protein
MITSMGTACHDGLAFEIWTNGRREKFRKKDFTVPEEEAKRKDRKMSAEK